MFRSLVMPRTPSSGRQSKPKGDVFTPTAADREAVKAYRIAKGWIHQEVATRIGVSQATISNIETGKHTKQVRKDVWLKLVRVLKMDPATATADREAKFKEIAEALPLLSADDEDHFLALVRSYLQKKR